MSEKTLADELLDKAEYGGKLHTGEPMTELESAFLEEEVVPWLRARLASAGAGGVEECAEEIDALLRTAGLHPEGTRSAVQPGPDEAMVALRGALHGLVRRHFGAAASRASRAEAEVARLQKALAQIAWDNTEPPDSGPSLSSIGYRQGWHTAMRRASVRARAALAGDGAEEA